MELAFGGGMLSVIFGLGGRCLLLGDVAGPDIIEVGVFIELGEAISLCVLIFF